MKTDLRRVVLVAGISLLTWSASATAQEVTNGGTAVGSAPATQQPAADPGATDAPVATTPDSPSATLQTQPVVLTRTQTKSVQRRVHVRADGVVGSGTRKAIKRFQSRKALTKTGRPNIETLRALKLKLADKLEAKLAQSTTTTGDVGTSASANAAITAARSQFGVAYRSGGTTTSGFDCSGLMLWAFKQAGVTLPRTSFDQYGEGVAVDKSDIQAGDLVFFNTAGPGASHVGLATSATTVISATTRGVMEHKLNDRYWGGHYVGARRLTQAAA